MLSVEAVKQVVFWGNVSVVDVDIVAIKEKLCRACFTLVIIGTRFSHLCASAMRAFYNFYMFTHVGCPILKRCVNVGFLINFSSF